MGVVSSWIAEGCNGSSLMVFLRPGQSVTWYRRFGRAWVMWKRTCWGTCGLKYLSTNAFWL